MSDTEGELHGARHGGPNTVWESTEKVSEDMTLEWRRKSESLRSWEQVNSLSREKSGFKTSEMRGCMACFRNWKIGQDAEHWEKQVAHDGRAGHV